jgi:hypothetical protein
VEGQRKLNVNNFFDLGDLFFNELMGSVWLAVLVGLLFVFILAIKKKIPLEVTLMLGMLWLMVCISYSIGLSILWIFLVLVIGAIFYYQTTKALNR